MAVFVNVCVGMHICKRVKIRDLDYVQLELHSLM